MADKKTETKVFERTTQGTIERADGMGDGTFSAVLATEGEASDGHILSIKGLEVPAHTPLLFGHRSELMAPSLGSIPKGTKELGGAIPLLRVTPTINLEGDGVLADIRRGMWQLVEAGDLRAMSVRWDGIETQRRVNLPSNHKHFVNAADLEPGDPRQWGLLFSKARQLEGSLVAIGADPGALIGRAAEADTDGAKAFMTALARSIEMSPDAEPLGDLAEAMAALPKDVEQLRSLGACDADIVNLMGGVLGATKMRTFEYLDEGGSLQRVHLPLAAWDVLRGESLLELQVALRLQREQPIEERRKPEEIEIETEQEHSTDRSIAGMSVETFFEGLGRACADATGEAVRKITGRL